MNAAKTREELIEEIEEAIFAKQVEIGRGGAGWHYVRVLPGGEVVLGVEASVAIPESEYFARPGTPLTIWSQQASGESLPRDAWEWSALGDAEDYTHDDCRIVDAAVEEAGGWMELCQYGATIEHEANTYFVFSENGKLWCHDFQPHDWPPYTLTAEAEAALDEWLAAQQEIA